MKLKYILIFLYLLASISNAQWFFQKPPTESYYLRAVKLVNPLTAWAVGYKGLAGVMMKTSDGGNTWQYQPIAVPAYNDISFSDERNGTAVGDKGTILRTTDGGNNWVKQTTPAPTANFYAVSVTDSLTGNIVAGNLFLRTTDGGQNWISQTFRDNAALSKVFFINKYNGIIVGDSVYRTTDGGETWKKSDIPSSSMTGVCITDTNTAFLSGFYGSIYKTTDGGNTWISKVQAGCQNSCWIGGISFANKKFGYYVGKYSAIHKTTDGGETWFTQPINMSQGQTWAPHLYAVSYLDSLNCIAVGEQGTIVRTSTGGLTDINEGTISTKPTSFQLGQNYPNPFNPATTIEYSIPGEYRVNISVYNSIGQKIKELVNEIKYAGSYRVKFDVAEFASGIYFYRLNAGIFSDTKKLLIIK